jgi:hypothetical protein
MSSKIVCHLDKFRVFFISKRLNYNSCGLTITLFFANVVRVGSLNNNNLHPKILTLEGTSFAHKRDSKLPPHFLHLLN